LGSWDFAGAAEVACLALLLGGYFHLLSRRGYPAIPDPATMLDQASQLASSGRIDRAIARLTRTIRLSPRLWQAYQYRGQLYIRLGDAVALAVEDFSEAIRLAPNEPELYLLRGQAYLLLGDESSSRNDYRTASALAESESSRPR
jgi:Flp pilus assembly protein TadD